MFFSAFYPTNEALNVWTHFIPGLFIIYKTLQTVSELENPTETITYPLWMYSFGEFARLKLKKSNLHYTLAITPKRVTSGGVHLRGLMPGQHSSEKKSLVTLGPI